MAQDKMVNLTPLEETVWVSAYAANQLRPEDKVYWACAAVFHLRGEDESPTAPQAIAMFRYMQRKNQSQADH